MSTLPNSEGKLILTEDEIATMRAIDSAVVLGKTTEKISNVSVRLYEQGVVEKSGEGQLVLTARGRKLLRASNMQG